MAEDQDTNELSGPAPGDEVPYEERFLSNEKQYPTKEARKKALDEAKLPHVPPFITEPSPKPDWQPVPEPATTPQVTTVGHLEAKGGAEPLRRILKAQEEVDVRMQQKATEPTMYNLSRPPQPAGFSAPEAPKKGLLQRLGNLFRRQPK
ncbi:hypothetical protein MUP46_03250 [Patescibacteria group bacterium]|nr:hypothetical protein [Patescibacteria group bacterium]